MSTRRRVIAGLGSAAIGLAASLAYSVSPQTAPAKIAHPDGWSINHPAGFDSVVRGPGIQLLEGGALRAPKFFWIETLQAPAPRGEKSRRSTDQGQARFIVEELGHGSGGTQYRLTVHLQTGDRYFRVEAIEQREFGKPDFNWAWNVVDSIR